MAKPFDLRREHKIALVGRERFQELIDLLPVSHLLFAPSPYRAGLAISDRYFVAPEGTPTIVDEQPVRDPEEPGREGATRVVAVPSLVNPQEELLVEILRALG